MPWATLLLGLGLLQCFYALGCCSFCHALVCTTALPWSAVLLYPRIYCCYGLAFNIAVPWSSVLLYPELHSCYVLGYTVAMFWSAVFL